MKSFSGVQDVRSWFTEPGPEHDVVLSSRVRLSRNLARHRFPGAMDAQEEAEVQDRVLGALRDVAAADRLSVFLLQDLSPTERRIMLERNMISQSYSLDAQKGVAVGEDDRLCVTVNEVDHVRMSAFRSGLDLQSAHDEVDELDTQLEQWLDWSVSLEWGYLNTEVTNLGTGMRASVMMHLPSLVTASLMEKAFKTVAQLGLSVKGFFGDGEHSLGDMYQVSNQVALGMSEREILEKLERVTGQLVHYEQRAREEMADKRRVELEDRVYRAYGILRYCKSVSSREAIELLSSLRLGIATGIIDGIALERVSTLLFLTQKSHIQHLVEDRQEGGDAQYIDYARAKLIRQSLGTD
jgi:protein arginine kinase